MFSSLLPRPDGRYDALQLFAFFAIVCWLLGTFVPAFSTHHDIFIPSDDFQSAIIPVSVSLAMILVYWRPVSYIETHLLSHYLPKQGLHNLKSGHVAVYWLVNFTTGIIIALFLYALWLPNAAVLWTEKYGVVKNMNINVSAFGTVYLS